RSPPTTGAVATTPGDCERRTASTCSRRCTSSSSSRASCREAASRFSSRSTSARRSRLSTRLSRVRRTLVPARWSRSCGRAMAAEYSNGTRPTTAMKAVVTRPRARKAYQARRRLDKADPQPPRGLEQGGQAQPHDVRVAALYAGHQGSAAPLDGVAAGLVDALAGGHVPRDLLLAQVAEADARAHHEVLGAVAQAQGVARVDVVDGAGEPTQVLGVLLGRRGL